MTEPQEDQQEAARQEALAALKLTSDAYIAVFGLPTKRTPMGNVILKDLERFARYSASPVTRDSTGRYDDSGTAYNTGMQQLLRRIHMMIEWSEHGDSSRNT